MTIERPTNIRKWPEKCAGCPAYVRLSLEVRGESGLCPLMALHEIVALDDSLGIQLQQTMNSMSKDGTSPITDLTTGRQIRTIQSAKTSLLPHLGYYARRAEDCDGTELDLVDRADLLAKIVDEVTRSIQ